MNIMFYVWLLITLIFVYFCSSFLFESIGKVFSKMINEFKNNINGGNEDEDK